MISKPLVDVAIGTYNHAQFIAQAIESVLAQKTDFFFRIIIGDDCSSDNTQTIIRKYAQSHPDKIQTILYTKHVGLLGKNAMRIKLYESCTAEYIALLEGDDYWTDPFKLQKQVDFLEMHPDIAMCCHPVKVEISDNRQNLWGDVIGRWEGEELSIEDIMGLPVRPELPTASMLFRNVFQGQMPKWFYKTIRGDTTLHLLIAHHGKVDFLEDIMAVHRKHDRGVSKLFETDSHFMEEQLLLLYRCFDRHTDFKYHLLLAPLIADILRKKYIMYRGKGNYSKAVYAFWQYLTLKSGVPHEVETKKTAFLDFFAIDKESLVYRCMRYLYRSRLVEAIKKFMFCL